MSAVDRLVARLERGREWPPKQEKGVRHALARWAAFRESDEAELRTLHEWDNGRQYIIDNLPELIADAYADLLYGEDPTYRAAATDDQQRLDDLVDGLSTGLRGAVITHGSEGEVWWRILADPDAGHPQHTFHSRCDVVPLLAGRKVIAAAFVSFLDPPDGREAADAANPMRAAWRHLEIHADGVVENYLYRGSWAKLGDALDLGEHPETADLPPVWDHGLPMLAGRVVNKWGRRPIAGVSDYHGIWRQFLVLNEAWSVGRENMRLTAKQRMVVPRAAIRMGDNRAAPGGVAMANGADEVPRPRWQSEEIIVHDELESDADGSGRAAYQVLSYSFDATALIAWMEHLISNICQRCKLVPQFIGNGDFGIGASGTALRVRLLPTDLAAEGKAREWDRQVPYMIGLAQRVDALPTSLGGFGVPWTEPVSMPSVQRTDPLPDDPDEKVRRDATAVTAHIMSAEQSIRERYPDWSDDQVREELDRIRADQSANLPSSTPFGGVA